MCVLLAQSFDQIAFCFEKRPGGPQVNGNQQHRQSLKCVQICKDAQIYIYIYIYIYVCIIILRVGRLRSLHTCVTLCLFRQLVCLGYGMQKLGPVCGGRALNMKRNKRCMKGGGRGMKRTLL